MEHFLGAIYFYWGLTTFAITCFIFLNIFFKIYFPKRQYFVCSASTNSELEKEDNSAEDILISHNDCNLTEERDPREEYFPEGIASPPEPSLPPSLFDDDYPLEVTPLNRKFYPPPSPFPTFVENDDYPPPRKGYYSYWPFFH